MTEKDLQKKAKEKLNKEGMVYWFPPFPANRTAVRDIWGVFDFIAIPSLPAVNKYSRSRSPYLVQITSKSNASKRINKIKSFMEKNSCYFPNAFVWAYDIEIDSFIERPVKL